MCSNWINRAKLSCKRTVKVRNGSIVSSWWFSFAFIIYIMYEPFMLRLCVCIRKTEYVKEFLRWVSGLIDFKVQTLCYKVQSMQISMQWYFQWIIINEAHWDLSTLNVKRYISWTWLWNEGLHEILILMAVIYSHIYLLLLRNRWNKIESRF